MILEPGDLLALYTDGLPEGIGPASGEAFGFERVATLLQPGGSPQEIHDRILRAFAAEMGEGPLTDDVTLVVVGRQDGE